MFDKKAALKLLDKLSKKTSGDDVAKIEKKLPSMNKGPVAKIWDKVQILFDALKNSQVSFKEKALIAGALLYLILPADVVPDFIPIGGFLDDVFVILFVFKCVADVVSGFVIEKVKAPVDEKIKEKINTKLNRTLRATVISTLISSAVMMAGILLVIFVPFGKEVSYFIASLVFLAWFVFMIVRLIRNVKNAFPWAKSILKEKSVKRGVAAEIKKQWRTFALYDSLIEKGSKVIPSLGDVPTTERIVSHYIRFFRAKVIVFAAAVAVYLLAVNFILKPVLIASFSDLKRWQIYLYPLIHIVESARMIFSSLLK